MGVTEVRFLILDDDAQVRATMRAIALRGGINVREASTADEFFSILESWAPTHIALDLVMPDMDGLEVILELARRQCRAGIIISSGIGSRVLDAARRSAREHGLNILGVLPKPFSAAKLNLLLQADALAGAQRQSQPTAADTSGFIATEQDIQSALDNDQFTVVFQPKVSCAEGRVVGMETLARWLHPEWGVIAPDAFIPVAERTGQIHDLTEQVLHKALHCIALLSPEPEMHVAVNLSAITISKESLFERKSRPQRVGRSFVDRIFDQCKEFSIDPSRLILELTESSAMEDPVSSLSLLTRLRMKGFQLSIDDFGTGFSSMQQLVRLPFSEIKVDKSFISTALHSEESRTIVRSIIDLGHNLGLLVTAEGVEDLQTLCFLRDCGCDLAQGFLIARPMTQERLLRWIADWKPENWFRDYPAPLV